MAHQMVGERAVVDVGAVMIRVAATGSSSARPSITSGTHSASFGLSSVYSMPW